MRVIKHRACHNGELVAAIVAIKCAALIHAGDFLGLTLWAGYTFGPAKMYEAFAALLIGAVLFDNGHEIQRGVHRVSMPRKKKHPKEMTTEELARHVFHPKVLAHAKKHIKALNTEKPVRRKSGK